MRYKIQVALLSIWTLYAFSETFAQQGTTPLNNADILSMMKAQLAEDVIVGSIQVSGGSFDVSPDGLIELKKAGVTTRVMEAMLQTGVSKSPDSPPAAPIVVTPAGPLAASANMAPPDSLLTGQFAANPFGGNLPQDSGRNPNKYSGQYPGQMQGTMPGIFPGMDPQPTVTLVANSASAAIVGERLQAISAGKGASGNMTGSNGLNQIATAAAQDTANRMLRGAAGGTIPTIVNVFGGRLTRRTTTTTYVWALRGKVSLNHVPADRPGFEVNFADIPGVDPDQFEPHIVRLEATKNNLRLVGATKVTDTSSANNGAFGLVYSAFSEKVVETYKETISPGGHMRITPVKELIPGEYAVVLRAISDKKTFSGDAISRNEGEGVLVNTAWSFSVK